MATERPFRFTPNVVVGAGVMLLGVVLLLDNAGMLEARALVRYWPVFLIFFGASVIAQAMRGETAAPEREGDRPIVTPGTVVFIVAAILMVSYVQERRDRAGSGDRVNVFALMSADDITRPERPFRGGEVTTLMGRTRIDLRQAELAPGESAVLDVLNVMGRTHLQVPPGWTVDVQAVRAMGGVHDRRSPDARPSETHLAADAVERETPAPGPPPRLIVRGFIMMGGLTVGS